MAAVNVRVRHQWRCAGGSECGSLWASLLYTIELTVSGADAAEWVMHQLAAWGYQCDSRPDGAVFRLTARGDAALTMDRFRDMVSATMAKGGAVYNFKMDAVTVDEQPSSGKLKRHGVTT